MSANRFYNTVMAFLFLLFPAFVLCFENEEINPNGRPVKYFGGKSRKCGIWYENGLWNISVTSGNPVKFIGSVKVTGDKYIGRFEGLEKPVAKKGAPKDGYDYVLPHKDGKGFDFVFNVGGKAGDSDTIQFKVGENATSVEFVIIGAGDRDPRIILIGKNGINPSKIPFSLEAFPKQKEPDPPAPKTTKGSPKKK